MLSASDLFSLEMKVRTHADSLRKTAVVFDDSEAVEVRSHAAKIRREADEFDMVGNLLVGLQGNWTVLGPMVRSSYAEVQAEYERRKAAAKVEVEAA